MSIEEKIEQHIRGNSELWEAWQEAGIDQNTPLRIDFTYYFASKKSAELLASLLTDRQMAVSITKTRSLLILVGYMVKATTTEQQWTLDKLNTKTKELIEITAQNGIGGILEDIGAYMPKPSSQP
jgi:Regulator of ribonuclease activity B